MYFKVYEVYQGSGPDPHRRPVWRWSLRAGNNQLLARSVKYYTTKANAMRAAQRVWMACYANRFKVRVLP